MIFEPVHDWEVESVDCASSCLVGGYLARPALPALPYLRSRPAYRYPLSDEPRPRLKEGGWAVGSRQKMRRDVYCTVLYCTVTNCIPASCYPIIDI
jgi:hypothetical protein